MKKILCLSGGGVRGIAQFQVLKQLEKTYGPLHEAYDLIIGTSVGAINASIIATGKVSMEELDNKYEDVIKHVFEKRGFFKKPKYDRNNLVIEWEKLFGEGILFGDAKTKLITTTVDLVSDTNIYYKSWHNDDSQEKMVDLVCRSFAAPLYFGQIVDKDKRMVYSDGGIGNANLPLNEAKLQAEAFGWYTSGEEVEIHVVGTLFATQTLDFDKVSNGRWVTQVLDYMNPKAGGIARAQSRRDQIRMMGHICSHISTIKFKYWDAICDDKYLILDGVKYMRKYKQLGKVMASNPIVSYN